LRLAVERHELGHKGLSPSAVRVIQSTQWDGNIRELAHHVEAAALSAEQRGAARIEQRDLLAHGGATSESEPVTLHQAVNAFQRRHIASVLASTGWNMTEAARLLDISRGHLYTLIRNLDLKRTPTSGVRTE